MALDQKDILQINATVIAGATHVLKYHISGCYLVQKYCESCLKKEGLMV